MNLCTPRTDFCKEHEIKAIYLIRSQCTIRIILKLMFQGRKTTYSYFKDCIDSEVQVVEHNKVSFYDMLKVMKCSRGAE